MFRRSADVFEFGSAGCVLVNVFVWVLLVVLYHTTLMRALRLCSAARRTMEPGLVWLNVVPLFGVVWQFVTANQVAASLRKEFRVRGERSARDSFGQAAGIALAILRLLVPLMFLFGLVLSAADANGASGLVMFATAVLALVQFILFVSHWSQVAGASRRLRATGPAEFFNPGAEPDGDWDYREFDDDYRPRHRRRAGRSD